MNFADIPDGHIFVRNDAGGVFIKKSGKAFRLDHTKKIPLETPINQWQRCNMIQGDEYD